MAARYSTSKPIPPPAVDATHRQVSSAPSAVALPPASRARNSVSTGVSRRAVNSGRSNNGEVEGYAQARSEGNREANDCPTDRGCVTIAEGNTVQTQMGRLAQTTVPFYSPQELCEVAGAVFKGILNCGVGEPLYLFDDPRGSTLALPSNRFNLPEVIARLEESAARWAGFDEQEVKDASKFCALVGAR